MREIEKMDLITKDNKKYITLDVIKYNNKKYAFVNEVTEEKETTENYFVFEANGLKTNTIIDIDLLNKLLPIFQKNLENEITNILKEEN
jgi:hypothetical protein